MTTTMSDDGPVGIRPVVEDIITEKTCTKCGETKPLEEFHKNAKGPLGHQSRCKGCMNRATADYRKANREAVQEYNRRYNQANRDAVLEQRRQYRKANLEAVREQQRRYQQANPHAVREQQRRYRQANPHVNWESAYRWRMRKFGYEPVVESFTREQLIERYGDACHHCEGFFEELDHYPIAVRDGGPHSLDNCVPSCAGCNSQSWREES